MKLCKQLAHQYRSKNLLATQFDSWPVTSPTASRILYTNWCSGLYIHTINNQSDIRKLILLTLFIQSIQNNFIMLREFLDTFHHFFSFHGKRTSLQKMWQDSKNTAQVSKYYTVWLVYKHELTSTFQGLQNKKQLIVSVTGLLDFIWQVGSIQINGV